MISQFMGNFREEKTGRARNRMPVPLACQACITLHHGVTGLSGFEAKANVGPGKTKLGQGSSSPGRAEQVLSRLLLAGVKREFLRTDHLAVQRAGNERLALDFAARAIGDGDAI